MLELGKLKWAVSQKQVRSGRQEVSQNPVSFYFRALFHDSEIDT